MKRLSSHFFYLSLIGFFAFISSSLFAQNSSSEDDPAARQAHIYFMDRKYDESIKYFKKVKNPDDNINYMLGYAQYQVADYKGAVSSFGKVIGNNSQKNLSSAYYYRAKANNTLAQQISDLSDSDRESLLQSGIDDYTKAIELNATENAYYLNRGIAYRDLGILRGTESKANYNKAVAAGFYDKGISDLQRVYNKNKQRSDLSKEIKKLTIYRDNLK